MQEKIINKDIYIYIYNNFDLFSFSQLVFTLRHYYFGVGVGYKMTLLTEEIVATSQLVCFIFMLRTYRETWNTGETSNADGVDWGGGG